jgi:hypothetical protein
LAVRQKILAESHRVLKGEGWLGLVDSLQLGDDTYMDWALRQFPKDFHEPFYTDYIKTPMEDLLEKAFFKAPLKNQGLLSKALLGQKIP